MSVRLLAGPFPIVDLQGRTVTMTLGNWAWYPDVGLLVAGAVIGVNPMQANYVSTLDGVAVQSSRTFIFGLGPWSWWPSRKRFVSMEGGGEEWVYDPLTLAWQRTAPEDQLTADTNVYPTYVKLLDRRIYISGRQMWQQVNGVSPDVPESEDFPFFPKVVLPGRSEHDVWVQSYPGIIDTKPCGCFYNTVARKVSSPVYKIDATIPRFEFLGYATEYGVLISVHAEASSTGQKFLRIWSLETHPTTLTPPEAFIGTPKSGQVVTYRVRVTGDDDDGAENELVEWALIGAGVLLDVQTKADAEGYATARVQYGLGESGSSTVEARVLC